MASVEVRHQEREIMGTSEPEPSEPWRRQLRRARTRAGLSQRAAARRASISDGTWANVESGTIRVPGGRAPYKTTPQTLAKMAVVVGLDPRETVTAAGLDPEEVDYDVLQVVVEGTPVLVVVVRDTMTADEAAEAMRTSWLEWQQRQQDQEH